MAALRPIGTARLDDAAAVAIAPGCGANDAPFGLDRPLPLLGGGARLNPCGTASRLGMEHLPRFRSHVAQACRSQTRSSRDWYAQPPVALLGPPGVGRGLAAEWLARAAGLPLCRVSAEHLFEENTLGCSPSGRSVPPRPVIAMAAARCANPVVLVELPSQVDLPDDAAVRLATMIDPLRSARWLDAGSGTIFDLSHINWIIQAEELPDRIAEALDAAGDVFAVHEPDGLGSSLRNLTVAMEVCAGGDDPTLLRLTFEDLERATLPNRARSAVLPCAALWRLAAERVARTRKARP